MTGNLRYCALFFLLATPLADANPSIHAFLQTLFIDVQEEYADARADQYASFCTRHELDSSSAINEKTYLQIHFFHDLLTCTDASNCSRGGMLDIPYFWHWVDPNPRHSIRLLPDSSLLSDLPPPQPYALYQAYADIDRVPALFLGDLVTATPKYTHPGCGSFFTFGWCSEREMSFVALMGSLGYLGKVKQSGIHTYSEVWCDLEQQGGGTIALSARVDNTFDSVQWRSIPAETTQDRWLEDIGAGTQIDWYNERARSWSQLEALRRIPVVPETRERILGQVRSSLREGP